MSSETVAMMVAKAVGVDSLPPDACIDNPPEWDSMQHLKVLMYLEKHLGIEFPQGVVGSLTSLKEIQHWVEKLGQ